MSKFYICKVCGNLVEVIEEGGGELVCCGQPMTPIKENTVEASLEKHIPVIEIKDDKVLVKVGSIEHPMTEEHYIKWIYIISDGKVQRIELKPGEKPEVYFCNNDFDKVKVYAYCNLHGLWKAEA